MIQRSSLIFRLKAEAVATLCAALLLFSFAGDFRLKAEATGRAEARGRAAAAEPQAPAPSKRPLTYDVVDSWRSIQGTRLSNDGQWLAYALTSQGEDGELVVRNVRSGQELRHARGTTPTFTADGAFVVFTIVPTKAEEEKERLQNQEREKQGGGQRGRGSQARNQPRNSLGIMALPGGQVTTIERVGSFKLPEDSSTWLAYYKGNDGSAGAAGGRGGAGRGGRGGRGGGRQAGPPAAPTEERQEGQTDERPAAKRKDPGADLILRKLASAEEITIPEVAEYEWDKKGTWLAYAVSSTDAAKDGAFARRVGDGAVRTLLSGKGHYKSLAFDDAGRQLAFLSDQAEYDEPVSPYRLYYWKVPSTRSGAADAPASELVSAATPGIPQGLVVSEHAAPRFSRDGARLYLGTGRPPDPPADPNTRAPQPIAVDVWSWNDPLLQPMQRVRADQERQRSYRAVVHLADKRFVQLATSELPTVNPGEDSSRAVGTSDVPYRREMSWDQTYNDVYLLDLKTGRPEKILEHWPGSATLSPGGRYMTYFDERSGDWFSQRIADGVRVNLTEKLDVSFQQENDTPDLPGPYGLGGWTADDGALLLYDEYDIWEIRPDGTRPRMITGGEGRRQRIVFRYRSLDPEERTIPSGRPLLLAATDDRTRATGLYRANLTGSAAPERIVMLDKAFGAVTKARDADTVVFTLSRYDEFPDLWVSDVSFRDMRKASDANPQQAAFVWGRSEIVDYVNADGKKLRAILTKPENFDPSKKYPMMVYIYEELTRGLHNYTAPNVGHSINTIRYVSNGYVLLRPDIVYDTGYPGESAEKCVIPAVNTVVAMGFIDPKRIGIQGHSWGGYQITHMITRTNIFAAVEAGASVSNMISAYGGIRWGTGMSRAFQYERTQSRIGAPPWDAPLQFIENSPIFWVEKIKTPYLTIHNDEDDAVPWYQGIEFITAMRRLGKEAYMFVYNGERHGLRNRDNQKHFTVHMDEFFDHYLLGKPRPEWMEKGVPFLERGKRDVSGMFKKAPVTTTATQDK
jgi:dipeptidyl aminopeptidase/acylaminoacyl peptidase